MKRGLAIIAVVAVASLVGATSATPTANAPAGAAALQRQLVSLEKRVSKLEKLLACEKTTYVVQYGDVAGQTNGYLYQNGKEQPFKQSAIDFVDPSTLTNPDLALAMVYRKKGC